MPEAIFDKLSFFRSQLENRRFDGTTLQILESVLVARDVCSLMETRSALQELLRPVAISVMQEIADKTVDQKLCTVEFFVRALAFVGDVESCLALKYEALTLRDTKYIADHNLRVSHKEWLTFAKDSLDNRFYSIAVKKPKSPTCIWNDTKGLFGRAERNSMPFLIEAHPTQLIMMSGVVFAGKCMGRGLPNTRSSFHLKLQLDIENIKSIVQARFFQISIMMKLRDSKPNPGRLQGVKSVSSSMH